MRVKALFCKEIDRFAALCYFEFTPVEGRCCPDPSPTRSRRFRPRRPVITGFNTDIPFEGVTYHVQTEDKGLDTPLILSLVYVGGAIIASKRTPYEDLLSKGFDEKVLTERLQRQHKLICAAIKAGRVEELKRMGSAHANGANGEATAMAEGAQATEGGTKPAGSRRKKAASTQPRVEASAAVEDKTGEVKAVKDKAVRDKVDRDKAEEVKTDKGKASEDEAVEGEKAVVKEAQAAPVGEVVEKQEDASRVAPLDFGSDFLANLSDEISALGDALQSLPAPETADAHEAVEESQVEVVPAATVTVEPEILQVEPLPFAFRGAPVALEPPEELYLSLLDDEGDFRAGQLTTIKVHVGRGAYGRSPVAGASVTVKILGTTFRPLILTTDTDERGLAIVRALLPRFNSGRAALIIRATSGEEFSELRRIIHQ